MKVTSVENGGRLIVVHFDDGYALPLWRNTETGGWEVSDLAYASKPQVERHLPAAKKAAGITTPVSYWQYQM